MSNFRILLIDDEPAQIMSIKSYLQRRKYEVDTANSGKEGIETFLNGSYDAVFTDFRMPDINGLEVLKTILAESPETPVVVITAFSQVEDAVEIMKAGAFDYLTKPIDLELLGTLLDKIKERNYLISENKLLKEQLAERMKFESIIYQSPKMEKVLSTVARVAKSKASVLIRGESGTGKEIIARAIHQASDRADRPMITVNCAALTESLLESELFGHEKGAFTGAIKQRIGRFEQADGGTLFIDEVGDIPLATQVKLLRAIQFGEFERVGGNEKINVDVRIIAATHRNLEEMIRDNLFREDLFYRINVIGIEIPPLRERKEDIPVLIRHFLEKFSKSNGKPIKGISKEAMDILMKYSYPGNIRELENIIESSVVLAREDIITTGDLPSGLYQPAEFSQLDINDFSLPYPDKVMAFEKALIVNALKIKNGNQSKAAELLGISERHLRSRMQKIGVVNEFK